MPLTLAQLTDPGTLDLVRTLFLNALSGVGFIAKTAGNGSGGLAAAGSPIANYAVIITIVSPGELGVAQFVYSVDGGVTYSSATTVPSNGTFVLSTTGVTLTFSTGPAPPSFWVGDSWQLPLAFPNFPITSWNSGGVARTLVEADAQCTFDLMNAIVAITNGGFLFTATGPWLDLVASNVYGLTRDPSQVTQGLVNLTDAGGGGPFTQGAGTFYLATASGLRYVNVNAFTIPHSSTVTGVLFQAVQPGAAYNVGNNNITILVTGLAGVTANNPDPGSGSWITQSGADTELDSSLQGRCAERWTSLGPGNPAAYYDLVAKNASPGNVTRTHIYPDGTTPGQVDIVLAGPSGGVSGGVITQVTNAVTPILPPGIVASIVSASGVVVSVTATIFAYASSMASVMTKAPLALQALIASTPIGGTIYLSEIIAVLSVAGVRNVVVSSPVADTVLTPTQVATLSSSLSYTSV